MAWQSAQGIHLKSSVLCRLLDPTQGKRMPACDNLEKACIESAGHPRRPITQCGGHRLRGIWRHQLKVRKTRFGMPCGNKDTDYRGISP